MREVTVVTKPRCQPCKATKDQMTKLGIEYTEADLTEDGVLDKLSVMGIKEVPAVFVKDDRGERYWTGYRPDTIKDLASA